MAINSVHLFVSVQKNFVLKQTNLPDLELDLGIRMTYERRVSEGFSQLRILGCVQCVADSAVGKQYLV